MSFISFLKSSTQTIKGIARVAVVVALFSAGTSQVVAQGTDANLGCVTEEVLAAVQGRTANATTGIGVIFLGQSDITDVNFTPNVITYADGTTVNCASATIPPAPTTRNAACATDMNIRMQVRIGPLDTDPTVAAQVVMNRDGTINLDCRVPTATQCRAINMELVNNMCQACSGGQGFDSSQNRCRACNAATGERLVSGSCQITRDGCTALRQDFDSGTSTCRACSSGQVFDSSQNRCRACNAGIGEQLVGNSCQITRDGCNALRQDFDSGTSTCRACSGGQGFDTTTNACRACNAAIGEQLVSGSCQITRDGCTAINQGLDGNTCRTCNAGIGERLVSGSCQITRDGCNALRQDFVSNMCQACSGGQGFDSRTNACRACNTAIGEELVSGSCQITRAGCNALRQDFVSNMCQACSGGQVFDSSTNTCRVCNAAIGEQLVGNSCQITQAGCNAINQRFDSSTSTCRACDTGIGEQLVGNSCQITQAGCNAINQRFDSGTSTCRACNTAIGERLVGNSCQITQAGCNAINQRFDSSTSTCRACNTAIGEQLVGNSCQITQAGCNANGQVFSGGICLPCDGILNGNSCDNLSSLSDRKDILGYGVVGLISGVGLVILNDVTFPPRFPRSYTFRPEYSYSQNDGAYHYKVGGVLDYEMENWRVKWLANTSDAGGFGYATNIEYEGDLWQASFSESVRDDNIDYHFNLSGKLEKGQFYITPSYSLHTRFEGVKTEWESETDNSLSLRGEWYRGGWKVQPSAGFHWQGVDEFGDNTKWSVHATYQF